MQLDNVLSALGHIRIAKHASKHSPEQLQLIRDAFFALHGKYSHNLSLLYNAYTEANHGEDLDSIFEGKLKIYADSGGLQMVTLKNRKPPEKEEIYANQGKWSDCAMSFDEIPVVTEGASRIGDTSNRLFVDEKVAECAKASGEHLARQIDYFLEHGVRSRPFLILQANCMDSAQRWLDGMAEALGPERIKHIAGVASAMSSFGSGRMEDFKRTFILSKLNWHGIDHKHIHLLGIGSCIKLFPTILAARAKLTPKDQYISYDSSTFTSNLMRAAYLYHDAYSFVPMGKTRGERFDRFYVDLMENMEELGLTSYMHLLNKDMLFHRLCMTPDWTAKKMNEEYPLEGMAIAVFYAISCAKNFVAKVEKLRYNKVFFEKYMQDRSLYYPSSDFVTLRDWNDFQEWEERWKKIIRSDAIKKRPSQLDDDLFY